MDGKITVICTYMLFFIRVSCELVSAQVGYGVPAVLCALIGLNLHVTGEISYKNLMTPVILFLFPPCMFPSAHSAI